MPQTDDVTPAGGHTQKLVIGIIYKKEDSWCPPIDSWYGRKNRILVQVCTIPTSCAYPYYYRQHYFNSLSIVFKALFSYENLAYYVSVCVNFFKFFFFFTCFKKIEIQINRNCIQNLNVEKIIDVPKKKKKETRNIIVSNKIKINCIFRDIFY